MGRLAKIAASCWCRWYVFTHLLCTQGHFASLHPWCFMHYIWLARSWGERGGWRLHGLQHFVYESILLAINVHVGWKQISPLRWESSKVAKCTIFPFKHSTASEARRRAGFACPGREEAMAMNPEPQPGSKPVPPLQRWHSTAMLSPPWPLVSVRLTLHCRLPMFSCVKWADIKCRLCH